MSWPRPEALHLTVRFFAEIDDDRAMTLRDYVVQMFVGMPAVDVPLSYLGGFPRLAAPRVLWIGPPDTWVNSPGGAQLDAIAKASDRACDALGLPGEDRRWRPHITLARVKDGERSVGNAVREVRPAAAVALRADHVTLYQSVLGAGGSRHTELWTVPVSDLPPHRPVAHQE